MCIRGARLLLLATAVSAQPTTQAIEMDDGVTLYVAAEPLDIEADRVQSYPADPGERAHGTPLSIGECDEQEHLMGIGFVEGEIVGAVIRSAVVVMERPGGRRDSVWLETECLFPPVHDGEIDLNMGVYPVAMRSPLAGGWRITHDVGDHEGYGGEWVVGRSWDAHRSGASAPFIELDEVPTAERLHTELALLVEGVRAQRQALDACAEAAGDRVCTDAQILRAHGEWLTHLERWAEMAALFQP